MLKDILRRNLAGDVGKKLRKGFDGPGHVIFRISNQKTNVFGRADVAVKRAGPGANNGVIGLCSVIGLPGAWGAINLRARITKLCFVGLENLISTRSFPAANEACADTHAAVLCCAPEEDEL